MRLIALTVLFSTLFLTSNRAEEKEIPKPIKYSGEFYMYHPKEKWPDSKYAGTTGPMPFFVISGSNGAYRSYCETALYYRGQAPFSSGYLRTNDFNLSYYTSNNLHPEADPKAPPIALGTVYDKLRDRPPLNVFTEILFLAFNRTYLKEWNSDLSEYIIFSGLKDEPELHHAVKEFSTAQNYEWQLWSTGTHLGTTYTWCSYRIIAELSPTGMPAGSYPAKITFENRHADHSSADPLKSSIFKLARFVVQQKNTIDEVPMTALYEDTFVGDGVIVFDKRNGQKLTYNLGKGGSVPVAFDSPILQRARRMKPENSSSKRIIIFSVIFVTTLLLAYVVITRRKKQIQ